MSDKVIKSIDVTVENFSKYGRLIPLKYQVEPFDDSEALTAWLDVVEFDPEARTVILLTEKRRPMEVVQMERHVKTDEWWTVIDGECVAVFAEGKDLNDPNEQPDMDKVVAFNMKGVAGYITKAGSWHWPAFPLTETATQFVNVRKETVEEDIDIKELPGKITIKP